MSHRRDQPKKDSLRGKLLHLVFIDHPILSKKWKELADTYSPPLTDYQLLEQLCYRFEEKMNNPRVKTLPYTIFAHNKLKNILKHSKIFIDK